MIFGNRKSAIAQAKREYGAQWHAHCEIEQKDEKEWHIIRKADAQQAPESQAEQGEAPEWPAQPESQPQGEASESESESQGEESQPQDESESEPKEGESDLEESNEDEAFKLAMKLADAAANAAEAEKASSVNTKIWIRKSTIPKPTKMVHHLADALHAIAEQKGEAPPSRKDVQDYCVSKGIASGTARTQYQAWKKARENAAANAQHAEELSDEMNAEQSEESEE